MKLTTKLLSCIAFATAIAMSTQASAAVIEFVPPNDTTGQVYTTNSNDGWSGSRGIGFQVDSAKTLSSVGLYQDLTNVSLSYGIYEISSLSGTFTRLTTLRSGSATVSTTGLEWIDFGFADLALDAAKNYLIDFSFSGTSNQNFFYNNANAAWAQDGYTGLEGTAANGFGNSVVAAFRVNAGTVPEPGTLALLGIGLAGAVVSRRRKNRA